MFFVFILTLIILGVVAAAGFIEKKVPQSKTALEFLKPYDGWIGLASMVLGLFWLFRTIIYLGTLLKYAPVNTLIYIASLLLLIILGFILCQNLVRKLADKNEKVINFTNKMVDKFAPLKEKLGLAAIATGLLNLVLQIIT